jgi:poly-gamma-glutamate system protein
VNTTLPIDRRRVRRIVAAGAVSLLAWLLLQIVSPRLPIPWTSEMREAAERMQRAVTTVARFHARSGMAIDASLDPNRTGLIGPEYTALFTSLGQLEAKRTTTNPDVAGLLVHLLHRAGVSAGDTIAVGSSGSFPALMIATLTATEAMGAYPLTILSLGASSYGATKTEFNLLDIHELLTREGVLSAPPAAVSLGGEGDVGADLDPAFREDLLLQIRTTGIPLVEDPDLRRNVARRMALYVGAPVSTTAARGRTAAFVNIGGSDANLGTSPLVLRTEPGLNAELAVPPAHQRGVLSEMAARNIPVIHLLNIRGLALRHGLPWDPVPLPAPGSTRLRTNAGERGWRFWLLTACYVVALGLIAIAGRSGVPEPNTRIELKASSG